MNFQLWLPTNVTAERISGDRSSGQSLERDLTSRRGRQWSGSVLADWNGTLSGRKLGKTWAISRSSSLTQNMTFSVPFTVLKNFKQERKGRNNQVEPRLAQNGHVLSMSDRKQASQLWGAHFRQLLFPEFSPLLQRLTQASGFPWGIFLKLLQILSSKELSRMVSSL